MSEGAHIADEVVEEAQQRTGFRAFCLGPTHTNNRYPTLSAATSTELSAKIDAAGWRSPTNSRRLYCADCWRLLGGAAPTNS